MTHTFPGFVFLRFDVPSFDVSSFRASQDGLHARGRGDRVGQQPPTLNGGQGGMI